MEFAWSEEQTELRNNIIAFARENLGHRAEDCDRDSQFPRKDWDRCAQFGIQGLAVPSAYGGKHEKIDILTGVLAMEGLGYGCSDNGLAFALNAQMWTVQLPIALFGSDDQKEKFLPPLCRGQWIGAHAITEPDIGSDAFNLKTTATKSGDGYVLRGKKRLVSLAPIADVILAFATVDPKKGHWGVTAFLVEKNSPGLTIGPSQEKLGLRSVPIGEINFDNCFVPEASRLGPEGSGFTLSSRSLEYERCSILASQIGTMERQLENAIDYAKTREQFGKPIGNFQSISNRIADMKLRLETSRLLLYKVAWLKKEGKSAILEAAMLKLSLSEAFVSSSLDAIRIHGGNGYLTENGVERDLRDSIGGILYAGTSDIQRNIIAGMLGLKP